METNYTNIPVHNLKFSIRKLKNAGAFKTVSDLESLSIAFENGIEEWKPLDANGWTKRMVTAKSVTLSLAGKRNYGDEGNNFIAGFALLQGSDCEVEAMIEFPSKAVLTVKGVIDVKTVGGGDSTAICPLEFDILSSDKPVYNKTGTEAGSQG